MIDLNWMYFGLVVGIVLTGLLVYGESQIDYSQLMFPKGLQSFLGGLGVLFTFFTPLMIGVTLELKEIEKEVKSETE